VKKRRSPKIRKGVTTENCETKKVNMKRREKEGIFAVKKYTNTRLVSFVHFVCAVIDVHYKKTLPLP
jgi:hypothetical protein